MNIIQEDKGSLYFFPYKPYEAQKKFMTECEKGFDEKDTKVMLFESPTGTGKTLMMMSAALSYLNKIREKKEKHISSKKEKKEKEDDWLSAFDSNQPLVIESNTKNNKIKKSVDKVDYLLTKIKNDILSQKKRDKMIIYEDSNDNDNINDIQSNPNQIFICTRTHSQISQIISEIKKIQSHLNDKYKSPFNFSISFLASRKHLCINNRINFPNCSISSLNSRCKEMNEDKGTRCRFHLLENEKLLSEDTLNKVFDIEEIVNLSKEVSACPFYGLKRAILQSDIILLPYNNLLNKEIRSSLNIDIKDKIIFFDEAHNIIDSVLSVSHSEINREILVSFTFGLAIYYDKYSLKLKSSNNLNIRQLIKISEEIIKWIDNIEKNQNDNKRINLSDFVIDSGLTSFNLFKLVKFAEDSEIGDKIKWIYEKNIKENEETKKEIITKIVKQFLSQNIIFEESFDSLFHNYISNDTTHKIVIFLKGITNVDGDGIVIVNEKKIKFQMINPKREFASLVCEAKKIIFEGGTMQPFDDFFNLFSLQKNQIKVYEGDHIINPENIFPLSISNDIYNNNEPLSFTYEQINKKKNQLYCTLLRVIQSLLSILENQKHFPPCGIAVFFQSYDFINQIVNYNSQNKILSKENLFFEKSSIKENIFELYKNNIKEKNKNSILFAVIGGKLSEGINFSDNIARILIVVGMPYSNIKAIEIREKMKYYDDLYNHGKSTINGNEYYDNICMKNVNQTIGRCIRHYNDYSVVIMCDKRYQNEKIKKKLPKWFIKSGFPAIENKLQFDNYLSKIQGYLSSMHKIICNKI